VVYPALRQDHSTGEKGESCIAKSANTSSIPLPKCFWMQDWKRVPMTGSEIAHIVAALRSTRTSRSVRLAIASQSLKHRQCFVRRVAVESLTALHAPGLVRQLVESLKDRCWEVRVAAAEGLELVLQGSRKAPAELVQLLGDSSQLVRVQAAEALGVIGDRRALPRLRVGLSDSYPLVRRYVAEAIGRLGNRADARIVQSAFRKERAPSASVGLAHAAYLLREPWGLAALASLLRSKNYQVRSAAASALRDATRTAGDRRQSSAAIDDALKTETTPAREAMEESLRILRKSARANRVRR
jgi:hypothetical protein